jgi:hypothetical protein
MQYSCNECGRVIVRESFVSTSTDFRGHMQVGVTGRNDSYNCRSTTCPIRPLIEEDEAAAKKAGRAEKAALRKFGLVCAAVGFGLLYYAGHHIGRNQNELFLNALATYGGLGLWCLTIIVFVVSLF